MEYSPSDETIVNTYMHTSCHTKFKLETNGTSFGNRITLRIGDGQHQITAFISVPALLQLRDSIARLLESETVKELIENHNASA